MVASTSASIEQHHPLLLNVADVPLRVTGAEFDMLCANNPDLRLELTSAGELVVMAPAGRNLPA
jgi:Uma2 family endonuclease